jgi:hypothetical protein
MACRIVVSPHIATFCTTCSEPNEHYEIIDPAVYCSLKCRTSDTTHENICSTKKTLSRIGNLLQSIYFTYRELYYRYEIVSFEKKQGQLHVHARMNPTPPALRPEIPSAQVFPASNLRDHEDGRAILSWRGCEDGVVFLYPAIAKLLKPIASTIEESIVKLRPRYVEWFMDGEHDQKVYQHVVTRFELANPGLPSYVIDLSGAQYGQRQSIIREDKYLEALGVAHHLHTSNFGNRLGSLQDALEDRSFDHNFRRPLGWELAVTDEGNRAVDGWERAHVSLSQLVEKPASEYTELKKSLLESAKTHMMAFGRGVQHALDHADS